MGKEDRTPDGAGAEALRRFLAVADQYRLGELPTERPHPETAELSRLAREGPVAALRLFHRLDAHALEVVASRLPVLRGLAARIGEQRIDVVHTHTFGSHCLGTRAARRSHRPQLRTEHHVMHYFDPSSSPFTRWAAARRSRERSEVR